MGVQPFRSSQLGVVLLPAAKSCTTWNSHMSAAGDSYVFFTRRQLLSCMIQTQYTPFVSKKQGKVLCALAGGADEQAGCCQYDAHSGKDSNDTPIDVHKTGDDKITRFAVLQMLENFPYI